MLSDRFNLLITCFLVMLINITAAFASEVDVDRPNILWIVSEDNSPLIGAYGDTYATTPNIDALAKKSIVYDNAFANSPVCSPTRSSIITGMHANAIGTGNMRSRNKIPDFVKPYTYYMRAAGYYATNDSKTDYNYATADIPDGKVLLESTWTEIDSKLWDVGDYSNRKAGQPFFHIYNIMASHEYNVHSPSAKTKHLPEDFTLPPYHPDTPEIRADWALYYDSISKMDALVGKKLAELEAAGELKNTIVFYYSDHGGVIARSKRFIYDTGTKIPFMVHVPDKFKHLVSNIMGSRTDQMIDTVDLAPTLLHLAGVEKPAHMQGHNIFSVAIEHAKKYNYLYRGRMDERIDLVRALRDKKFKYTRNYMPHRSTGQHLSYLWNAQSIQSWQQECLNNRCNKTQQQFWQLKEAEELYDIENDPWEVNNLAKHPDYNQVLSSMRETLKEKNRRYKDIGFIPEGELAKRTQDMTAYQLVRQTNFPINLVIETAEIASLGQEKYIELMIKRLSHQEATVRYWAAVAFIV
ncbi:MAG: sulfatase, partial [Colwellia sp.]|nr:sulfatase [Colwellia sp.]